MTDEELRQAASSARDRLHAESLAMQLGLACETHPEIIRKALEGVFSLQAVSEEHQRILSVLSSTQALAEQARALALEITEILDACERRLENFCHRQHQLEKANGHRGMG